MQALLLLSLLKKLDKLRDRIEVEAMQCDFELRTHDRASLLSTLFASLMILLPLGND